jgi:hypothetical protein
MQEYFILNADIYFELYFLKFQYLSKPTCSALRSLSLGIVLVCIITAVVCIILPDLLYHARYSY